MEKLAVKINCLNKKVIRLNACQGQFEGNDIEDSHIVDPRKVYEISYFSHFHNKIVFLTWYPSYCIITIR